MEENKRPSLLIVEDDFENQKFLQLFLKRKFDVDLCDSAESFYEKMKEKKFDLILMDISLRGKKDGLQLKPFFVPIPIPIQVPISFIFLVC